MFSCSSYFFLNKDISIKVLLCILKTCGSWDNISIEGNLSWLFHEPTDIIDLIKWQ